MGNGCCSQNKAFLPLSCCTQSSPLLERAPELVSIATKLQLVPVNVSWKNPDGGVPKQLHVDALNTMFGEMSGGTLDFASFWQVLGLQGTSLLNKVFKLMDLNDSGAIDFYEFLFATWNFCTLQVDKNVYRCVFQLYQSNKGTLRWSEVHEMVMDMHGSRFHPRIWLPVKKAMQTVCKNESGPMTCTFEEFVEVVTPLPQVFMPAFSLREELRQRFFSQSLFNWAARIRKKDKYNQNEIVDLQLKMTGMAKLLKQSSEISKIPVKHSSKHLGSVHVGRSTIAKAYGGSAALNGPNEKKNLGCEGRFTEFKNTKEVKVIARRDKTYISG